MLIVLGLIDVVMISNLLMRVIIVGRDFRVAPAAGRPYLTSRSG